MRKAKLYLAGMALGIFLTAGNMPLVAKAANISPNSRGTIITDNDVPGDNGEIPPDYVRVQNPGTEEYVVIPEEDVPQAFVKVQDPIHCHNSRQAETTYLPDFNPGNK